MTEWTLLKRLLDAVHQHSTMIGRLWLTVMVIFRLLVVAVATEDVYTDEQEMFVCNTLQPGCSTVCYDAFAPISQPRFWVFHIISVSTPSLCFIIYTWHNLAKLPQRSIQMQREEEEFSGRSGPSDRRCDTDSCSICSQKRGDESPARVLRGITEDLQCADPKSMASFRPAHVFSHKDGRAQGHAVSGVLSKFYVLHVCLRAVLEVGFVVAQWKLFGFQVPVHFLCSSAPCSQPVDCYVSRPTEKTIFLLFMFCVGVFCIVLNLLELNHLGWKKIHQAVRKKERGSWGHCTGMKGYDTPSFASCRGFGDVTSTVSLPTLDLVMGHQPDGTCVVNFGKIREAEVVREFGRPRPNGQKSHIGGRQPLKTMKGKRASKARGTEVWI
ncbi:gap junction protein delta 6 [Festucalex cinctus]